MQQMPQLSHERVYHWYAECWDVPFVHQHDVTLQQDTARPHVARICTQFRETEHVPVLPWHAYSPDISAIEHVWDLLQVNNVLLFLEISMNSSLPFTRYVCHRAYVWDLLDRRVRQRVAIPGNELRTALQEEWDIIPQATIDNLAGSIRRGCRPYCPARCHWRTYQILSCEFRHIPPPHPYVLMALFVIVH